MKLITKLFIEFILLVRHCARLSSHFISCSSYNHSIYVGTHYYACFTDKETEAQRNYIICSRWCKGQVVWLFSFFLFIIHLFLAVLGLHCWAGASVVVRGGFSSLGCSGFHCGVFLVAGHWFCVHALQQLQHGLTYPAACGIFLHRDWTCVPAL